MFELSVACKYLLPRRRQLSVSIISLISILVIALVVWLIVVFFSVTDGLEKNWVQKLTALTAPVRMTPTEAYYNSHYYLVDSISDNSNYSFKTIGEKKRAQNSDPYQPELDEEAPAYWAAADLDSSGKLKDLVKLAFSSIDEVKNVPGIYGQDYELTGTHLQLKLVRPSVIYYGSHPHGTTVQSSLNYPAYLGNFEGNNQALGNTFLRVEAKDYNNMFSLLGYGPPSTDGEQKEMAPFKRALFIKRLDQFFKTTEIQKLKTRPSGWNIPPRLLPEQAKWTVCLLFKDQEIVKAIVPQEKSDCSTVIRGLEEHGLTAAEGKAEIVKGEIFLIWRGEKKYFPTLTLAGDSPFPAQIELSSIEKSRQIEDLVFKVEIPVQGEILQGKVPYRGLEISQAKFLPISEGNLSWWIHKNGKAFILPHDPEVGEGIALPKSFRDAGVLIGDRGFLSYYSPTASIVQEQQIPIYVAGFYDQGIIPIGGKYILANPEVTSLIRSSHQQKEEGLTNGINIRFDQLAQADNVKGQLLSSLKKKGIHSYWNVETYKEYEFTKEIMHELQSQKNLFMLIAVVIILVACSNIISMLVILVNDKKTEIGILRSMGASSKSIAFIFGTAGAVIGAIGSGIGILAAIITLQNLDALVGLLSKLQGHQMFSAHYYGQVLPHELSYEALSFVLLATVFISLLAGIVPAIKACLLRPSQILRSGGN